MHTRKHTQTHTHTHREYEKPKYNFRFSNSRTTTIKEDSDCILGGRLSGRTTVLIVCQAERGSQRRTDGGTEDYGSFIVHTVAHVNLSLDSILLLDI
jgi:hypothetical protein